MPSYVIGSAWTIQSLTLDERARLDREPFVLACNQWLSHWRRAGFRPSVWAWGDTDFSEFTHLFAEELRAVKADSGLRQRPGMLFCSLERAAPMFRSVAEASRLEIHWYRRGEPWRRGQRPADSLNGTIYHFGSTLTDLCNLAWILNPGEEIRLTGCPRNARFGHFYESAEVAQPKLERAQFWRAVVDGLHEALDDLRRQGLPIVDCNDAPLFSDS
jgi:hypothetical protein